MSTKIAVCQVPDIREDAAAAVQWIEKFTKEAEAGSVSLICFPECFLHGYLTDEVQARRNAIHLQSSIFGGILRQLSGCKPMIVFGLIEEEENLLFNTAVVIKDGTLIGKYRKTHLLDGEKVFTAATEYPLFEIDNLKFGINICYDTQFPEATARLTNQGGKMILCLSNTMMGLKKAIKYKSLHLPMRAERAREKEIWMLSADVTGEQDGRIAYGTTSAITPAGEIVDQVPSMEIGMIIIDI